MSKDPTETNARAQRLAAALRANLRKRKGLGDRADPLEDQHPQETADPLEDQHPQETADPLEDQHPRGNADPLEDQHPKPGETG